MTKEETQETSTDETTEEVQEGSVTADTSTEQSANESDTDYRARLNAQNRFLEKEGYEFKDGKWVKPASTVTTEQASSESSLSPADIVAIRDLHEDDIPTLQKWAKREGITLAEARKDPDLKIILSARADERATAEATHTGGGSRGAKKPSGAELLDRASRTNELPDDDEGMAEIAAARIQRSRRKKA